MNITLCPEYFCAPCCGLQEEEPRKKEEVSENGQKEVTSAGGFNMPCTDSYTHTHTRIQNESAVRMTNTDPKETISA